MIVSMTGYGRAEATIGERTITIELRSVNNRYFDCTVKIPRVYLFAEEALKARVQSRIARGKVDVFVSTAQKGADAVSVSLNRSLAEGYLAAFEELAAHLGMENDVKLSALARYPDVLLVEKAPQDMEAVTADLCTVLDAALDAHMDMRCREGLRLQEDILARLDALDGLTDRAEARSPQTVAEYRSKLEQRMREVLEQTDIDESRLLTEAALFADKVAVSEEIVRLRSHMEQARDLLRAGGSVGRKLDFLLQELNREANTIGSKGNDIEMARTVVEMKAEIEKIREQIQNIE